jgi:hypothetical protein
MKIFKDVLKGVISGVLDAIPLVPNFIDRKKINKAKTLARIVNVNALKSELENSETGKDSLSVYTKGLKVLIDAIDDGSVNDSFTESKAESLTRAFTNVLTGSLIIYELIKNIL